MNYFKNKIKVVFFFFLKLIDGVEFCKTEVLHGGLRLLINKLNDLVMTLVGLTRFPLGRAQSALFGILQLICTTEIIGHENVILVPNGDAT